MKPFQRRLVDNLDKKWHVVNPMQRRRKWHDGIDWAKIMEQKRKELEERKHER